MSNIYFFRGKAATGKTTITNILSRKLNVPILRKDDVFDVLSQCIKDNPQNNSISYDVILKLIQTNINNKADIIVDIGLSNTNEWRTFNSKLDLKDCKIFIFLCGCSDANIWKMRFIERLKNPTPNQYFNKIEEAIAYYEKSEIKLLDNEYYVDSSDSLLGFLNFINSMLTSIVTRRREFAMMQGIGMTNKQLNKLLIYEGIYYALATIAVSLVFGGLFSVLVIRGIASNLWFYSYKFTIEPTLWSYPVFLIISGLIHFIAYKGVNRQSIVERLREA